MREKAAICRITFLIAVQLLWAAPALGVDNVAGNLIQFNCDGNWSWFMDERAIVDTSNGTLLISSQASSKATGIPGGTVYTTAFKFDTGRRTRVVMREGQQDDHNAGALLLLPDGKYLTMYSNHGNAAGLGDEYSWWRVSKNPHDPTSWAAQKSFNWNDAAQNPGRDPAGGPRNNVAYHNLFYLRGGLHDAAGGRILNISRASAETPSILEYNPATDTMAWRGQLLGPTVGGYSVGYLKYASNNIDKVFFVSTETHPRNYNTSLHAGYVTIDGKSYRLDGSLADGNTFDSTRTGGTVPNVTAFTPALLSQPDGVIGNRTHIWPCDLELDDAGHPVAASTSRGGVSSSFSGTPPTGDYSDHRLWYSRFDGTRWVTHEVARMGRSLFPDEQDYTGLAAIDPSHVNVLYVSTPVDPATGAATAHHEIYKGVTSDSGATWKWTAITSNSSVDNLRPIVPRWDANHTLVLWFRGTYTSAQIVDAAVVGVIDPAGGRSSAVTYVDATTLNTTRADGADLDATGPSTSEGAADRQWHRLAGIGNGAGNDVLSSGGAGPEDAPLLKATITGIPEGRYEIYAYFWANAKDDWRIKVGFNSDDMMLVRHNGAQQAEAGDFDAASGAVTVSQSGVTLYRTYVGRVTVSSGGSINVYVDDAILPTAARGATRAWYDGVGYAPVPEPTSRPSAAFSTGP